MPEPTPNPTDMPAEAGEPAAYVIGWNMPGYMPEMDPYPVASAEDARAAMLAELDRAADYAAEITLEDLSPAERETELSIGRDIAAGRAELAGMTPAELTAAGGFDLYAGNLHYWITPAEAGEVMPAD